MSNNTILTLAGSIFKIGVETLYSIRLLFLLMLDPAARCSWLALACMLAWSPTRLVGPALIEAFSSDRPLSTRWATAPIVQAG